MKIPPYYRIITRCREDSNGCWIWQGTTDGRGYGRISLGKVKGKVKKERTHRIMYITVIGPIPNGMVVRHKCDNKLCCNPAHLEIGTHAENIKDWYVRGRYAHEIEEVQEDNDCPF